MVAKKPKAKATPPSKKVKAAGPTETKKGPGRTSQIHLEEGEEAGPLRVMLPDSCLDFLTKKNQQGLSRAAYIQQLLKREMAREELFEGKSDLEMFFGYLERDIEKGSTPAEFQPFVDTGKRFLKRIKKLESGIYSK